MIVVEHNLIPLLFAISAFLFALSFIPAKNPLARQLDELRSIDITTNGEEKLALFERILSQEHKGRLERRLVEAGWYAVTPARIVMRMAAGLAFGSLLAILILRTAPIDPILAMIIAALVAIIFGYSPLYFLNRAVEERKVAVQRALPDFLDIIATTVRAGLSVNAAIAYAVEATNGPLSTELAEALMQMRLGRGRAESLKAAAQRLNQTEFSTAISAITQAERMGSNIGQVLTDLADDTRNHRVMIVEEHAAKLPVKMVFPMAFFMLPCLFVVIFGTIIANFMAGH